MRLLARLALAYTQGAVNPANVPLLSYEAIAAAAVKHNEQQAAAAQFGIGPANRSPGAANQSRAGNRAGGANAPADDPLVVLSEYMARAKVQLATLLAQFDADRDGQLSGKEAAKLLRFAGGARLRGRAMERAMDVWRRVVDVDGDGFVSYTVRAGRGGRGPGLLGHTRTHPRRLGRQACEGAT